MSRSSLPIPVVLFAVALSWPHLAAAQTFKVDRYSIGGDGGTDYLTAEPRTGRVFVSRGTHVMVIDDGTGRLFVNNESKNTIQVLDAKSMKVLSSWPLTPCDGPTGIAFDRSSNRIFSGCGKTSVVIDPTSGRVVSTIANGDGVDALGWDASEKLIYIPAGRSGNVTVVRQDSPDKYTVVATVPTMPGAKTISVDQVKHVAYLFQPEYGPAPAPASGSPPPAPGRGPRGPVIAAWFFAISH